MNRPVITLTTDFGLFDHYVAAMKGVILGICPIATLVDISHGVPAYSLINGAWVIGQAWRSFPAGTIHVVVVDPGVGSERRAILVEADGQRFVAPDNGVLEMVLSSAKSFKIREISASKYFRQPVSQTFHGRDVFAPVAAHLATGVASSRIGSTVKDPVRLPSFQPIQTGEMTWSGIVLHIDHFGNVSTNFSIERWPNLTEVLFRLEVRKRKITLAARAYSLMNPGAICLIPGSAEYWELSCNQMDAAKLLDAKPGDGMRLTLL